MKIQKTLGKIVIDNNQKVTWIIFYYQLSKLHQGEAKVLKFYKPCELFDIILLLRRNRWLGVAGNWIWVFLYTYFAIEFLSLSKKKVTGRFFPCLDFAGNKSAFWLQCNVWVLLVLVPSLMRNKDARPRDRSRYSCNPNYIYIYIFFSVFKCQVSVFCVVLVMAKLTK